MTRASPCASPASSPTTSTHLGSARIHEQRCSAFCDSWGPTNTMKSVPWCSHRQMVLDACMRCITLSIFSTELTVLSLRAQLLLLPALALWTHSANMGVHGFVQPAPPAATSMSSRFQHLYCKPHYSCSYHRIVKVGKDPQDHQVQPLTHRCQVHH